MTMAPQRSHAFEPDAHPPEGFVVEVFSELSREAIQQRWPDINVVLRLSMLTGVHMQLEPTLNLLCDFASEIAPNHAALAYFWDQQEEQMQLRVAREVQQEALTHCAKGNIYNFWATKFSRPLLIERGKNQQADAQLEQVGAASALVVPLFVSNRVVGSIQLFSRERGPFTRDQAQMLWILALVAENLLTREQANEDLIRFAFTDFLTGLRTRGYFEQQLDAEIKRSERKALQFALMMLDIDHFKQLNDTYGHHVGDQVLRDVGAMLVKDMREVDTVARYGGEEFVIILPETNGPGALQVAERIRRSIDAAKFFAGSPQAVEHLTMSIGIAVFDGDAQFKRELIDCADAALYAAKSSGRNQVVLYSDMAGRQQREVS